MCYPLLEAREPLALPFRCCLLALYEEAHRHGVECAGALYEEAHRHGVECVRALLGLIAGFAHYVTSRTKRLLIM